MSPDRARGQSHFGAVYDRYSFSGATGDAILVDAGAPQPFVFWEHACNIPWWHVDAQTAFTYEFFETWGKGAVGCCEPMSDRECRYSRARILQTHEARCVVHWRYALCDQNYSIYDGSTWVDETFSFYPDGCGIRRGTIAPRAPIEKHEVMEFIVVNAAGTRPTDHLEKTALTIMNASGVRHDITWPHDPFPREVDTWDDLIYRIRLKDRPSPFVILTQRRGNGFPGNGVEHVPWTLSAKELPQSPDGTFLSFDHWPIARNVLHGEGFRIAKNFKRPTHTSLISFHNRGVTTAPRTWLFLIGMTEEPDDQGLLDRADSWIRGAWIRVEAGAPCVGPSPSRRAWVFDARRANMTRFRLRPRGRVVLNPVFVLRGIPRSRTFKGIHLQIDGRRVPRNRFRCGPEYRFGGYDVVVWVDGVVEEERSFAIAF
jgi:hypothetical protein